MSSNRQGSTKEAHMGGAKYQRRMSKVRLRQIRREETKSKVPDWMNDPSKLPKSPLR